MEKTSRPIFIEAICLTLSLMLTVLFALLLFGQPFLSGDLDLHLHDTYFVVSPWLVLTPLFLLVTFIIYFFKSRINKFNTTFGNWILVLSGLTLIISLTVFIKTLSQFAIGGFTLYPPLSALGPQKIPELKPDPLSTLISNFLTVVQVIILTMTLFAAYRWGTQEQGKNSV